MLEKTLENLLDCKDVQPVHPKGSQCWIFIGRIDADAETTVLWLPDAKNWLIGKDPDAEKDWRQKEKGTTEDEMIGWHHQLNEHEFEQTPGVGDGQAGLMGSQRVRHYWATELKLAKLGGGCWDQWVIAKGFEVSFWDKENILKLIVVIVM